MGRLSSRRALLVLALFTGTILPACGGTPRLGLAEFTNLANQECASLKSASNAFRKAQDPAFTGDEVTGFVHRVAERLRRLVEHVDALAPPESLEADVDTLLDVLGQYADGLDELGEKTEPGQTFQGVLEESTEMVTRLNELATRATVLVGEVGLVGCILPS